MVTSMIDIKKVKKKYARIIWYLNPDYGQVRQVLEWDMHNHMVKLDELGWYSLQEIEVV